MKRISILLSFTFLFCFSCYTIKAQDLHFTNNFIVPTFFNPAQTGAFAGNLRGSMLYRDQWRSFAPNPFQQAVIAFDSPIVFGLSKQHWVGVGATLFYDKAGAPGQTWSGFYPSVSYHVSFDKKFKNVITLGVQYGFANRGYNTDGWVSEDEVLGISSTSPDRQFIMGTGNNGEDFSAGYSDLNVGLLFKSTIDKYSKFEIGAAMMHVLNPSFNFSNGGRANEIGSRINVHTKYRRATGSKMIWEPAIYYSSMPGASIIQVQLRNQYRLKKKGDWSIISGLGFRVGDAAQLLAGAQYKDWVVALSYDYGVSELASEGIASAYELGVQKLFVFNKKPKVKPIIFCPRL
ncbi:MAG: PorP/SprF family type IX secretion system membrane protein [Saprospiraceae bacterium]|nr:PorP/SprF family type IX secretion system membrane protein [Saprospiraceae bacterium]